MAENLLRRYDGCEVLVRGIYPPGSIHLLFLEERIRFPVAEGHFIQAQYERTKSQTLSIFDGPLAHVRNFSTSDDHLHLDCQRSSYMEYVGTDNTEYIKRFGRTRVVNPLSCGTVLETSDRELIYGCRGGPSSTKKKYGLPAGYVNPDSDRGHNGVEPFFTMTRELEEEIGILRDEVQRMRCLGLLGGEGTHLVFLTEVGSTSEDIRDKLPRGSEFEKLESIGVESVTAFLELKRDRMLPHSLGALVLYDTYLQDLPRSDD